MTQTTKILDKIEFVKNNYGKITRKEIARILSIKEEHVKYLAKNMNLSSSLCVKRNSVNDNSFSDTFVLKSCYWAGFIAADGCVSDNILSVCLGRKDLDHLLKLKKFLKSDSAVTLSKSNGNTSMNVNSPKIVADLHKNFNIVPRKSLNLRGPSELTENQALAYIIGYIDGDGSIGVNSRKYNGTYYKYFRLRIIGTREFLNWVNEKLGGNATPTIHCKSKIYISSYNDKGILQMLKRFIELNSLPVLTRKWIRLRDL